LAGNWRYKWEHLHVKSIGGESRFLAFFDECGDHSMEKIDKDFPLFVLALVVVESFLETQMGASG
jgi:hypothetical protein